MRFATDNGLKPSMMLDLTTGRSPTYVAGTRLQTLPRTAQIAKQTHGPIVRHGTVCPDPATNNFLPMEVWWVVPKIQLLSLPLPILQWQLQINLPTLTPLY